MRKVVVVKFRTSSKHYYFDPGDLELKCGDYILVETTRGTEMGIIRDIKEVSEKEFGKNLKRVKRKATEEDMEIENSNLARRKEAVAVCKEKVAYYGLDMKLIDAEYTLDNSKLIFYFTADKRVDFRELVKDLAGRFHMRIELRQIGVRDEARLLGGIGSCGRELCCKGWLQDFEPVSIKMAKVQNLSLNPGKISGCCGRLMCCLKYENDVYAELKKGMPNPGEVVDAPTGRSKVMDVSIFKGTVRVRTIEADRTKDSPERLSDDLYEYEKSEIRRTKGKGGQKGTANGHVGREIADALKDEIIDVVIEKN